MQTICTCLFPYTALNPKDLLIVWLYIENICRKIHLNGVFVQYLSVLFSERRGLYLPQDIPRNDRILLRVVFLTLYRVFYTNEWEINL